MAKKTVIRRPVSGSRRSGRFVLPPTVSHSDIVKFGSDDAFRLASYTMIQAAGRLHAIREAFGRAIDVTGSQWAVLIGTAARQEMEGVSIRALADYIHLAPTHVTTEVGRLIRKGLLRKRANKKDRRGVLVQLSPRSEAALAGLAPVVRRVNDVLFQNISRREFDVMTKFLDVFVLNTEYALAELRRIRREQDASRGL
jgi:DNA-binding MarR family transcriptional regulator